MMDCVSISWCNMSSQVDGKLFAQSIRQCIQLCLPLGYWSLIGIMNYASRYLIISLLFHTSVPEKVLKGAGGRAVKPPPQRACCLTPVPHICPATLHVQARGFYVHLCHICCYSLYIRQRQQWVNKMLKQTKKWEKLKLVSVAVPGHDRPFLSDRMNWLDGACLLVSWSYVLGAVEGGLTGGVGFLQLATLSNSRTPCPKGGQLYTACRFDPGLLLCSQCVSECRVSLISFHPPPSSSHPFPSFAHSIISHPALTDS